MAGQSFMTSTTPPVTYQTVTPSDTAVIGGFQFLRIGGAGNLCLKDIVGNTFTIAVFAGEYVPFGSGLVMSTGTTATGIVAFG